MDYIDFKIRKCSEAYMTRHDVCVSLVLQNNSDKDIYVPRDALMLDGCANDKFEILDANNFATKIPYIGKYAKCLPKNVEIKAHSEISTEINLAKVYDFGLASVDTNYLVNFNSMGTLCTGVDNIDCSWMNLHDELFINIIV